MDYNSSKNQDIKGKFVGREVMCCVTDMTEYIIRKSFDGSDNNIPFTEEDIENYYMPKCPECGSIYGFEETEFEDEDGDIQFECENCGIRVTNIDDLDKEPQEIYEWWAVTTWFGEKLKAKGEPVIELWGKSLWGRTGTGQAILLDCVISEICEDMEILEGQKYEWSVN